MKQSKSAAELSSVCWDGAAAARCRLQERVSSTPIELSHACERESKSIQVSECPEYTLCPLLCPSPHAYRSPPPSSLSSSPRLAALSRRTHPASAYPCFKSQSYSSCEMASRL